MHTIFGRVVRYVLWFFLLAILSLLFVGLAKNNRDLAGYVQSLNQKSRSDARQEGGISGIFRQTSSTSDTGYVLSSGDMAFLSGDAETVSGIDVYDPNFEQDLATIPQDTLSGDYADVETDYGFTTETTGTAVSTTGATKSQQLLDLINKEK